MKIEKVFKQAEEYKSKGNFNEAIALYEQAIKHNPNCHWYYYYLGEILTEIGQLEQAINNYYKVIQINPDFAGAHHSLGNALIENGRLDESIIFYKKAVKYKPDFYLYLESLADALNIKRYWLQAAKYYYMALEFYPSNTQLNYKFLIHYNLASTLVQIENVENAIIEYKNSISLNPDFFKPYKKLHQLLQKLEKKEYWQDVINIYENLIKANKKLLFPAYFLEEALTEVVRLEEGIAEVRLANDNLKILLKKHELSCKDNQLLNSAENKLARLEQQKLNSLKQEANVLNNLIETTNNDIQFTHSKLEEVWIRSVLMQTKLVQVMKIIKSPKKSRWESFFLDFEITNPGVGALTYTDYICFKGWVISKSLEVKMIEIILDERVFLEVSISEFHADLAEKYSEEQDLKAYSFAQNVNVCNLPKQAIFQIVAVLEDRIKVTLGSVEVQYRSVSSVDEKINISPDFLSNLAIKYLSYDQVEDSIKCYQNAIQNFPNLPCSFYRSLSYLLLRTNKIEEALNYINLIPDKEIIQGKEYLTIWMALNQSNVKSLDLISNEFGCDLETETVFSYFSKTSQYKLINCSSLNDENIPLIREIGLSEKYLQKIQKDDKELEEFYRSYFVDSPNEYKISNKLERPSTLLDKRHSSTTYFNHSLFQTGYVYSISPISGKVLRTNQSFYIPNWLPIFAYRFSEGPEIFYLLVGHHWGGKLAIYFPRLETIIILFNLGLQDWRPGKTINMLKAHMVSDFELVKSYLLNESKKMAMVTSFLNMAHFFWEDLTGCNYLFENNLLGKVDKIIVKNNFLSLEDLINVPKSQIKYTDNWSQADFYTNLFKFLLEQNYVAARVVDLFIPQSLASRINKISLKKCSLAALENIERAKQHFPLICFGIRAHNRTWLSQVKGIASIVNSLYANFPNIGVVIAGCCRNERNHQEQEWEEAIFKEQKVWEQIELLLNTNIKTYKIIGCSVYESVVWHSSINLYVIPISSGLSIPVWICHKPGVTYGNSIYYDMYVKEQFSDSLAKNCIAPVYLSRDNIQNSKGGKEPLSDYDFNWELLYQEVLNLLQSLGSG